MSKFHISNNTRLVLDILDYNELISDNSFILFLNFYKCFRLPQTWFILKALTKFGFGEFFRRTDKTLYNNVSSCIKLKHVTSQRFNISHGIKQGSPISPSLFLVASQLLGLHISNCVLKVISVAGRQIISQLADDTTLFLKDTSQVSTAVEIIQLFLGASGLHLNCNKCELLSVKDYHSPSIYNIPVKEQVMYLGIVVSQDQS